MSTLAVNKETLWYQGGLLALVAAIATLLLLVVSAFSADAIAEQKRLTQLAGLAQVLPSSLYQNDILQSVHWVQGEKMRYQVFVGKDDANVLSGYAIQGDAVGYSGHITFLVGLDASATILGVRVLAHTETPGLGDKIEIAKSQWITSFLGHSLSTTHVDSWAVKKDGGIFDQFTGATVTPRALVNGVYDALQTVPLQKVVELAAGEEHEPI